MRSGRRRTVTSLVLLVCQVFASSSSDVTSIECSWIFLNGTDVEDWSPSFPLSEVHKIALKRPVAVWQEFSFGFELSDGTPVGSLKFQNDERSAVLTLKSISASGGAPGSPREQQVRLPQEESRQLSLKYWTFISLTVNDGRLEVEIDDAGAVKFDQVDATHFYQVYGHVSRGHMVDVSFNCFTEGEMTSASGPPGGTDDLTPSGEISVGTTIAVVIILLVLFAAKAGLWYRRRLNRRKDEEVPGDDVNVEHSKAAEMKPLMFTRGAVDAVHVDQVVTRGAAEAVHDDQVVMRGAAEAVHADQVVTRDAAEAVHDDQVVTRGAAEAVHDDQAARQSTVAAGPGDQNATHGVKTLMHEGVVRDTNERQSTVPGTMTGEARDANNTDTIERCAESPTNIQITQQRPIHTMIDIATSQDQNNTFEESRTDSPVDTLLSGIEECGLGEICQKVDADIVNNTCNNDKVGVDPITEITKMITELQVVDNTIEDIIHKPCMATSSVQNDNESLMCTTGERQQSQELVEVKDKDTRDLTQSSSTETNNVRVNSKAKTRAADNVSIDQNLMTTQHSAAKTLESEHDPQPPGIVKDVPRNAAKDKVDEVYRRRENTVDGHDTRKPTISTNDSGADDIKDGASPRNTSDPRMPQDEESHSGEIRLGIQKYKEFGLTSEYPQSDSQLKDKKSKTKPHKSIDYVESRVRKNASRLRLPL